MIELALALCLVGLIALLIEPVIARARRTYFEQSALGQYIRAMEEQIAEAERQQAYYAMVRFAGRTLTRSSPGITS